jgi:chromosome segregation protein
MLKSLEIFGFKSFADRIRFDFAPGTTGVVGPNGSGKSNVVDSIKWILGDQSAKSLRGKEMTDVIFNGASGRKPSAFAEATLTFDNSTGFLPVETAEVQIGRRISRSGEGEYLINRAPARLKDIRDLFMGTGAGSATYCIIEQGRVEQILQANASARRLVFEEAAGISRYKNRKLDAERKLERVDQNVARLTDIVNEVEAQLNAIRNQAVKAAKYRQISEQLRELWLGLAADQYREQSAKLAEVEAQLATQNSTGAEWDGRIAEIQSSLARVESEIARLDETLRDVDGRRADLREESARQEATVRHQSSRVRELEADLVRLRRQRTSIESRGRDAAQGLENARQQAARIDEELAAREAVLAERARESAEITAELAAQRKALEAERQGLHDKHHELSEASHRQSVLNGQADELRVSLSSNRQQRAALEKQIEEVRDELARQAEQVATAAEAATAEREALDRLERDRLALAGVQEQFHKTLADRREQRSAWRARKSVLEDLESRQEGLGLGVREILSRAANTKVAPWNQVIGSVADLFEVDLEWAPLIEIALGRRSEAVVVDDLVPFLDYLSRSSVPLSGRVGFIPSTNAAHGRGPQPSANEPATRRPAGRSVHRFLETLAADAAARVDLRSQPGVECRADSLVRTSDKAPALAEQLLADAWIVDTVETAFALAAGPGRGCRFVTLQGELVEADGTLTVGALRGEITLVSQKSELRRLRQDLVRIDRQIQEDEERSESILASLGEADTELHAGKLRLDAASEHHHACKRELAERERELARLDAQHQGLEAAAQQQEGKLEQTQEESAQAALTFAALDGQIQASRQHLGDLETELATLESRSVVVVRRQNTEQLEIAKHEERRGALRQDEERLEREQLQFRQQSAEADRRVQQVLGDRRRISLHILNTNAALAECCVKVQELAADSARLGGEKDGLRKERAGLMKEESALSEERRRAGDRLHQLELQARELSRERESLVARIDEEYQVRLSEIVESGISALANFAAKKQSEAATEGHAESSAAADPAARDASAMPDAPTSTSDVPLTDAQLAEIREEIEAQVNRLRRQLKAMGSVNTESLHDLDEMENRFTHLSEQLADLVEAKKTLEEILRRINAESTRLFAESFQSIRAHFQELFRKFFGGGEGDVVLENPDDILECGIEIVARPPGKELRSLSLLSGGEKTLTAVALLLAIFKSRPSPFCILDEVDAALDEANVERFAGVLREFKQTTQFIMITHSKRSMAAADLLYGVTMEESGVSKRLSVRFEDVDENGAIRGAASQPPASRRGRDAA